MSLCHDSLSFSVGMIEILQYVHVIVHPKDKLRR